MWAFKKKPNWQKLAQSGQTGAKARVVTKWISKTLTFIIAKRFHIVNFKINQKFQNHATLNNSRACTLKLLTAVMNSVP
jgi:hypothetical protein